MARSKRLVQLMTLAIVCLVFFVDIANIGMANIALPTIQKDLGYDQGSLQWILTAYSLTFGGFLLIGGRLGDIFGHRTTLIFGMSLFNVASLLCAVVNDKIGLVIGRAIQGVSAAFSIPSAQSMVALSFEDPKARIRAFGMWGACGSSGFVFGPIFGGLFTSRLSWEWIFWFSLIVEGALEISVLALLFTNNLVGAKSGVIQWAGLATRLDLVGTVTSLAGLILLVYGLTSGNIDSWDAPQVIATLVVAAVLLLVFVFVESKTSADPILPRYLWGDRIKIIGCVSAALTYAVWQGANYILTLELQSVGFSPLSTALRFLPLGITALAVNFVIPMLVDKVAARTFLLYSWVICAGGIGLLAAFGSRHDYWRYCLPGEILYIAGVGTVYFIGNIKVVATAKAEQQGTVSGVYNMFLNVGGAVLGVAILTAISNSVTSNNGGEANPQALLDGYRAGYYGAIAMSGIGFILALFFYDEATGVKDRDSPSDHELKNKSDNATTGGDGNTE